MTKTFVSMGNNDLLSRTISYLRFPLMVGVVFIHFNTDAINPDAVNPNWLHYITSLFSYVLSAVCVPLFFFFSGFLFFYHSNFNADTYKKKLKSRIRTLLIPYILWNIIALINAAIRLLPCLAKLFPNAYKRRIDYSLSAILNTFWNNQDGMIILPKEDIINTTGGSIFPADVPMWYIRDLMIVIICAPILYWIIKKMSFYFIIALGLVWYIAAPLGLGYLYQLIFALLFFSWGAFYSIKQIDFTTLFQKLYFVPILYATIVLLDLLTEGKPYNWYIHSAGIILGMISAISITVTLLERGKIKINSFLVNASFFLFALHVLFMKELGKAIYTLIHIDSPYYLMFLYFFVPIATIFICLGLYKVLRKHFPRCIAVLTGGR